MNTLAVAVLGPDSPGIIAALTEVLLREGGNLEDASMTLLRGQFAMTLVVQTSVDAETVGRDLAPVAERLGLLISVRDAPPAPPAAGPTHSLRLHGADRPGLVHRATALVAQYGGNILDLTTRVVGAPSAPGYVLVADVDLPEDAVAPLTRELAALAAELGVDIALEPIEDDVL